MVESTVASFKTLKAFLTDKQLILSLDETEINNFFEACKRLLNNASNLKIEMAVYGEVSNDDMSDAFMRHVELIRTRLHKSLHQKEKLKLAAKYLEEQESARAAKAAEDTVRENAD